MPRKHTIEFIRSEFEKEGYKLLTKEYINSRQHLECICPKQHEYSICWDNWQQGNRCAKCAGNEKLTIGFVKEQFEKEGYKLLTKTYINNTQKLEYICPVGHYHSIKWNKWQQGVRCKICYYLNNKGKNHPRWVGGENITNYDSYAHKINFCEKVRRAIDSLNVLEVKCAYCGKWFKPTAGQTQHRLSSSKDSSLSEGRFYCSENCKLSCPTYGQRKYPKGFKQATSREVVPLLRQLVLERDNYTCQKCDATTKTAQLHVHHIISYAQNKMQANDPDSCITLCKKCHQWVHSQEGCRYADLKCPKDR